MVCEVLRRIGQLHTVGVAGHTQQERGRAVHQANPVVGVDNDDTFSQMLHDVFVQL
jgi:hypothetical protein